MHYLHAVVGRQHDLGIFVGITVGKNGFVFERNELSVEGHGLLLPVLAEGFATASELAG